MRKTMPKTAKKPTRSKLVKKLDVIFSQFIRLKYSDKHGMTKCFTCDKRDHYKSMQCGHFMSRKHYSTRWDENNVRVQCPGCNVFQYGKQYEFGLKLGQQLAEEMYIKSKQIIKFTNDELVEMINHYSSEVKRMT
jgi:hypothetical protein